MEFVVYVLYATNYDKHYIGYTSSLIGRFQSHNKLGTKGYTKRYRPWKVIHVEFYTSKAEAMLREKFLKSGQGRRFIKDLTH